MPDAFTEPGTHLTDPAQLLPAYLDAYREAVLNKLDGLTEEQLRAAVLPSGWSPLGLVKHLANVERRWLQWGFAGEDIADPWPDTDPADPDAPWYLAGTDTVHGVLAGLRAQGERSRALIAAHALTEPAPEGPRFDDGPVPTLAWIVCHLFQEYARHLGHLDAARELLDGTVGE